MEYAFVVSHFDSLFVFGTFFLGSIIGAPATAWGRLLEKRIKGSSQEVLHNGHGMTGDSSVARTLQLNKGRNGKSDADK